MEVDLDLLVRHNSAVDADFPPQTLKLQQKVSGSASESGAVAFVAVDDLLF